jgi:hypothetical protein
MTTQYPGQIDGYVQIRVLTDRIDEILARDHNDERSAIIAIEQTLGINPQGIHGTVVERLDDEYSSLQYHVGGGVPRHPDTAIESTAKTGSPYFSLATGTVGSQLTELLSQTNGQLYDGSLPSKFADGYFLPASRVDSAITQLVKQLGLSTGASRVGYDGSGSLADGYSLPASTINQALDQIIVQLGGVSGNEKVGTSALTGTRERIDTAAGSVESQTQDILDIADDSVFLMEHALAGSVISGMAVTRTSSTVATIASGTIAVRGRVATYAGGTHTHGGVGSHVIYAVIDSTGAVDIKDSSTAAVYMGTSGNELTVPLRTFTESGVGWTDSVDLRRFGQWVNNKPYITIGVDGYGADFTSIISALRYITELDSAGGTTAPKKLVLVSDITASSSDLPYIVPAGAEIDGSHNAISWDSNSPLFQTYSSNVVLNDIRSISTASSLLSSSAFFKIFATSANIDGVRVSNCKQTGDNVAYFIQLDDSSGAYTVQNIEVTNCLAQAQTSAFRSPSSQSPASYVKITDSTFYQDMSTSLEPAIMVGTFSIVDSNTIIGGFDTGILAEAESTIISGNNIIGGPGTLLDETAPAVPKMSIGIQMDELDSTPDSWRARSIIANNIINGASGTGIKTTSAGTDPTEILISGNIIDGYANPSDSLTGIRCGVADNVVENNIIINAGDYAIHGASTVIGNYILDSYYSATTISAIYIDATTTRPVVMNNYINNFDGVGIALNSVDSAIISGNYLRSSASNADQAINGPGAESLIYGNYFYQYGTLTTSITIEVRTPNDYISIVNNHFEDCDGIAIDLDTINYATVCDNKMIGTTLSETAVLDFGTYSLISGNLIRNYGTTTSSTIIDSAATADNSSITNNTMVSCDGIAVTLGGNDYMMVSGNAMYGVTASETAIINFGTYSLISDNIIYNYGSTTSSPIIDTAATANNSSIVNNIISDCDGIAIALDNNVSMVVNGNTMYGGSNASSGITGFGQNSIVNSNLISSFGVGSGYAIRGGTTALNSIISDNVIFRPDSAMVFGIGLQSGSTNVIISNNTMGEEGGLGMALGCIDAGSSDHLVISGNVLIGLDTNSTDHAIQNSGAACLITSNFIRYPNGEHIELPTGSDGSVISNNILLNGPSGTTIGVSVVAASDIIITGNYMENVYRGVEIRTSSPRTSISGNFIVTCSSAIVVGSICNRTLVCNNYVNGHTSIAMDFGGADEHNIIGNITLNPSAGQTAIDLTGSLYTLLVGNRCEAPASIPAFTIDFPADTTAAGNFADGGTQPNGFATGSHNIDSDSCRHI